MNANDLPILKTEIPGPLSRKLIDILARHECPAITARRARRASALGQASHDPPVWETAQGSTITDVDGNRYVDLCSGFGVAFVGHRHPAVTAAADRQQNRLVHAMGDAFPDRTRIALLERLADISPLPVAIFGLSGSDAVDGAVKTARLATGRSGVLTFSGAYHGLALGVLGLQGYKESFTDPFRDLTHPAVHRLPFGCPADAVDALMKSTPIGLILVEPILGRGGIHPAPPGWLAALRSLADRHGALLAFDEVQSGLGRTGAWFAWEHDGVEPDLICIGKALGGGFPISATLGSRAVMDAWGASDGEALHTQTFLGHPVGCAAGLAVLDLIEEQGLRQRATAVGEELRAALAGFEMRGRGLMRAVTVGDGPRTARKLLERGFICLPAGPDSIGLTPPVCLSTGQIDALSDALRAVT